MKEKIKKLLGIIFMSLALSNSFPYIIKAGKKEEIMLPENKIDRIQEVQKEPDKPKNQTWQIIREPMKVIGEISAGLSTSVVNSIKDIIARI